MATKITAVDKPELAPFSMPDRFRLDIAYFMSVPGEDGVPKLPEGEYWITREDAVRWLEEGVMDVVSPLDSENKTEVEITEEQEDWLQWLVDNDVQHVRLG